MGKLNLKLGCLVYPCFSCSTFLFTEKSLHKDMPVVLGVQYIVKIEKDYLLHSHFFGALRDIQILRECFTV